jgi:hypothetical protein
MVKEMLIKTTPDEVSAGERDAAIMKAVFEIAKLPSDYAKIERIADMRFSEVWDGSLTNFVVRIRELFEISKKDTEVIKKDTTQKVMDHLTFTPKDFE